MKVKSVGISGMHNVTKQTYNFDNVNYLYGLNGAGKSTILQAIQLGILGYIPGTAKRPADIFKHANGPLMDIELTLDNNTYIHRTWRKKGRSIECDIDTNIQFGDPKELAGDLELPIFNFNELINLSANKLKDWFINFLPDASSELNWKQELTDSLDGFSIMDETLIDETLCSINSMQSSSTLHLVQQVNDWLKEEQSYLKKELQRAEATIQSLVYYDEDDLTGDFEYLESQIAQNNERIKSLTAEREQLLACLQVIEHNQKIRNQLASIPVSDANIEVLKQKAETIPSEIDQISGKLQELDGKLQESMYQGSEYSAEIKTKNDIINGGGICPYTQSKCDSIITMIEQLKEEVINATSTKNELQSTISEYQLQIKDLRTKLNAKQHELYHLNSQIASVQNNEALRNDLQNLLMEEPDISRFLDPNDYTDEIAKCNEYITKIQANKKYNELIDKLTSDKYKIENTIEVYKVWIKLTDPNGLQTRIMDEPFNKFEEDMNHYLSLIFNENFTFKFNLEQKANSFSFGIIRNKLYIPYDLLSSGEKTMFTLAMMICIIDKSNAELKLLIVDDMLDHLDDNRATEVFSAISKIRNLQAILAGVKYSNEANTYMIHID